MKNKVTYKKSGVNYDLIDPLKIMAQKAGLKTAKNLKEHGFKEVSQSRGESAYVIDLGDFYIAAIEECLGTKSLVADTMYKLTGKTYYDHIAQDTIAMMVNDVVTVGAKPLAVFAYWATGDDNFFKDTKKLKDLVDGWEKGCNLSGASWGGGETPTVKGVVKEGSIDLAGSCVGIIKPKLRLTLGDKLNPGDRIILLQSSGIHANGLSLARKVSEKLKNGYKTIVDKNKTYGELLLTPTVIYAKLIDDLFKKSIDIHYMVNITGHGWRKIMRHNKSLSYYIDKIPPVPKVLQFIQEEAGLNNHEAYSTFNMGAGFAIFVPEKDVEKVLKIAKTHKIKGYNCGFVKKGKKEVLIKPLDINYKGDSLRLRI